MSRNLLKSNVVEKLLRKKSPDELISESKKSGLKKTLNAFDLIVLGVGAIIGTGIFSLSGIAINGDIHAGPSFMLSIIIASFVCLFSALSYAEFAAMIPVAGSGYTYTYSVMGEFAAWIMGWLLILEYAIGNITVAKSWSYYWFNLLQGFDFLPDIIKNPKYWMFEFHLFGDVHIDIHIPALLLLTAITYLLYKGVEESAKTAALMVFLKIAVIALFVIVGAFYVKPENWTPFAPGGMKGILQGTFIILLAYVGFDAVSTAAEETKNPKRDIPIGIVGSLFICSLVYVAVAAVLTGIMPWNIVDPGAPIAEALRYVNQGWIAGFIAAGALAGLTSVLLVLQLGVSRILLSMARDNLLPPILGSIHERHKTPHIVTIAVGAFVAFGTLFLSVKSAAQIANIGTLIAFSMVSLGVIILRKTDPDRPRSFKVPFVPYVPALGILCSLYIIYKGVEGNMPVVISFFVWMLIGIVVYFSYGFKQNTIAKKEEKSNVVELAKVRE